MIHAVRPQQTASEETASEETASEETAGLLAAIGLATVEVSLLFMVSITVAMAAAPTTSWIDGLGVAAFATLWGGPGFGLMFGGAAWTLRRHQAEMTRGEVVD